MVFAFLSDAKPLTSYRSDPPPAQLKGGPPLAPKMSLAGAGVISSLHTVNSSSPFLFEEDSISSPVLPGPSKPRDPQLPPRPPSVNPESGAAASWVGWHPNHAQRQPSPTLLKPLPAPTLSPHTHFSPCEAGGQRGGFAGSGGLSFFLSFSFWKPGYYSSSL